MNRRTLRILLEAVAITICLLVIVEQQSEAGITSKVTAIGSTTLWLGQTPTASCGKAVCE